MPSVDRTMKAGCCRDVAGERARPNDRRSRRFLCAFAALFLASAAGTIVWCASMSDMPDMPMAGGWTMSMAWMRMPEQTWLGATASFLAMWTLMMVAMMTPSLAPVLWRCQDGAGDQGSRAARVVLVGAGYFFVWAAQGALVFPVGVGLASAAMRWPSLARLVPVGVGLLVLAAGLLQVSPWKARHLACCRTLLPSPGGRAGAAWRQGVRLGLHCGACCAGLTATLLALGVMDLAVMAAVTVAVTAERVAPVGAKVARAVGAVLAALGLFLIVRVLWPV